MRGFARSLFALALALAPPAFRREYGRSMRLDLDERLGEAAVTGGAFAVAREGCVATLDLVRVAAIEYLGSLGRDLSYAARSLRATPGFAVVVVATLTLAIGANVTIFSILRAVALAPLPYADPGRLVAITGYDRGTLGVICLPDLADTARATSRLVSSTAAFATTTTILTGRGAPRSLVETIATPRLFATLGVAPEHGRLFRPGDGRTDGPRIVVVASPFARRLFGDASTAVGAVLRLDGLPYRIVGVAPASFRQPAPHDPSGFTDDDLWRPVPEDGAGTVYAARSWHQFNGVARVRSGVTVEEVDAAFRAASERLARRYPDDAGSTLGAASLTDVLLGSSRSLLLALFVAVAGVVLVACANVANLLLSRNSARAREIAVRLALGASRRRIAVQALVETLLLGGAGGFGGVAFAVVVTRAFVALDPPNVPRVRDVAVDPVGLLYTFCTVVACVAIAGLAPAVGASGLVAGETLGAAGRGGDGARGGALRSALVVTEIALTLGIVVSAGLVVRGYVSLVGRPLGFRPADVAVVGPISPPPTRYGDLRSRAVLADRLLARARATAGVRSAMISSSPPFMSRAMSYGYDIEGRTGAQTPISLVDAVSSGESATLGTVIVAGRAIAATDTGVRRGVAVVNRTFARLLFPSGDAIGHVIVFDGIPGPHGAGRYRIVGISADTHTYSKATEPTIAIPYWQDPVSGFSILVRADPGSDAARRVAREVVAVDPLLPLPEVRPLDDVVDDALATSRLTVAALVTLAVVAFSLAIAGVSAVVSYGVERRTHEFGIRTALGAPSGRLTASVVLSSMRFAVLGVVVGVGISVVAERAFHDGAFDVRPADPTVIVLVVVAMLSAAALAAFVPAHRATRRDPVVALRYD